MGRPFVNKSLNIMESKKKEETIVNWSNEEKKSLPPQYGCEILVYDGSVDDYKSIFNVEAALFDASITGKPFSDPINAAIIAYSANGFDADEWTKHHQGGPTGFLPRDWPAHQMSTRLIAENQPIAWNPTGEGWKAEDTILATNLGPTILSNDPDWPTFEVNGRTRPFLLLR